MKGLQLDRILDPRAELGAAGDVDGERLGGGDRGRDVAGVQAAAEDDRRAELGSAHEVPVHRAAGAAGDALDVGVEQQEVGVECGRRLQRRARLDAHGLDDLRAGAARDLAAEHGSLVAVQLDVRQARGLDRAVDLLQARVDEHADEVDRAPQRVTDHLRLVEVAAPRRAVPEDHPQRPGAGLGGAVGVFDGRDPAVLDARRHQLIVERGRAVAISQRRVRAALVGAGQRPQRGLRIGRPHERLSDEHAVDPDALEPRRAARGSESPTPTRRSCRPGCRPAARTCARCRR